MGHGRPAIPCPNGADQGLTGCSPQQGFIIPEIPGPLELQMQEGRSEADIFHNVMIHIPSLLGNRDGRVANVCRIIGTGKIMILRVPDFVTEVRAYAVPGEPPVQHIAGHSGHIGCIADKPCPVSSHAIAHLTEFLVHPLEETVPLCKRNGRDRRRFLDQGQFRSRHLRHFPLEQGIIGKGFLFLADAHFFPSIQCHKKTAFLVLFADL